MRVVAHRAVLGQAKVRELRVELLRGRGKAREREGAGSRDGSTVRMVREEEKMDEGRRQGLRRKGGMEEKGRVRGIQTRQGK